MASDNNNIKLATLEYNNLYSEVCDIIDSTRQQLAAACTNMQLLMYWSIGNRINKVPFLRTDFTTTVDIRHTDIEERPLIRYDYYNGVSFQPSVNDDVYVERGITQAFEKYIKFSEIKTFEDLENYANGGFFVISKEDIDLG